MKPLLFLTTRSLINGVRRALTSPQRLIGLIVVLLYYFNFLLRPFSGRDTMPTQAGEIPALNLPPLEVLDSLVFGLFAVLSIFMMMGALAPRGGFRPADVDVLFPTPLNPRIILCFRLLREYLFTLLFPLLIAMLAGPPGMRIYAGFFRSSSGAKVDMSSLFIAWFLMSLAWVCLGFGLSMFVNRSDAQSDRNKKIINGLLGGSVAVGLGYLAFRLIVSYDVSTALEVARAPLERALFFSASFASSVAMGPVFENPAMTVFGSAALLSIAGFGVWLAMTQVGYMYDQAAARGFFSVNLRNLQRSGDTYGMVAEQARRGKVRAGRIAGWISRYRATGGKGLLWKEMILQTRGAMWQYWVMGPIVLFLVWVPLYGASRKLSLTLETTIVLVFQSLGVFMITLNNATSGFIELLRRVDIQKPLPFTPTAIVFWEILAKAVPTTIICTIAAIGAVIIDPQLVSAAIASIFLMPTLAVILTSVVLLVTILFPDVDDAAQRSFRGLMMMLGSVIVCFPGALVMGSLLALAKLNPIVAALPVIALNLGITGAIAAIAGGLYAGFNPSE